jgi:hypothetical protein
MDVLEVESLRRPNRSLREVSIDERGAGNSKAAVLVPFSRVELAPVPVTSQSSAESTNRLVAATVAAREQ